MSVRLVPLPAGRTGTPHTRARPTPGPGYQDPELSGGAGSVRRVTGPADVPPRVLRRLRSLCLGLPEAREEPAWVGIRWRVRNRTFAHVYTIDPTRRALPTGVVATGSEAVILTFRSAGAEFEALIHGGHPYFRPGWGSNVVGMVVDDGVDWTEVAELLTDSFCVMAPKKLAALVPP